MAVCYSCFHEYGDEFDVCPHCGVIKNSEPAEPNYLRPGILLADRYMIGHAIDAGGFGIVYKAYDTKMETVVAVKEFFVSRMMTRAAGETEVIVSRKKESQEEFRYRKKRFLAEARTMAKFGKHRSIPNVFEFFEENGTAYIVMELLVGCTLNRYMEENGKPDQEFAVFITNEIGQALIDLHKNGIIHRDVAPDNIYISTDGEIRAKLLDLGAAKLQDDTDDVRDIILKPGYSPCEQYEKNQNIGPWSDVYALGAVLYLMLTGKKPEESTDRKIEDNVPAPHELDPAIPENLSNAVMKGMTVDLQFRFSNVPDFLNAVNGEKKVVSLKREKKRRFQKRMIGIIAICVILLVAAFFVFRFYQYKKLVRDLNDASISVWFAADDGSDEVKAMEEVIKDFNGAFPNVSVEYKAIPEEEYEAAIENAAESGNLPTLFESTDIPAELFSNASDVGDVLKSDQAGMCLFLDQYDNYYSDRKKIPLGIEVPVAYVITNGNVSLDYEKDTFKSISDFGEKTPIAVDDKYQDLINRNFDMKETAGKNEFIDNESNSCAVLLSSSMELNDIRESLTNYEKECVYYANEPVECKFVYEWSLGNGSDNELMAATRLLSWMLGNKYQTILMLSRCSDGQIPINEECFESKTQQNYYTALQDIYKNFVFEKQE